jgi:hypothetical protein
LRSAAISARRLWASWRIVITRSSTMRIPEHFDQPFRDGRRPPVPTWTSASSSLGRLPGFRFANGVTPIERQPSVTFGMRQCGSNLHAGEQRTGLQSNALSLAAPAERHKPLPHLAELKHLLKTRQRKTHTIRKIAARYSTTHIAFLNAPRMHVLERDPGSYIAHRLNRSSVH